MKKVVTGTQDCWWFGIKCRIYVNSNNFRKWSGRLINGYLRYVETKCKTKVALYDIDISI